MPDEIKEGPNPESHASEDRITPQKTLYQASAFEIFWRNFLAGFSRALGGIILYVLFIGIIGSLAFQYLAPLISPVLNQLNSIYGTMEKLQGLPGF